MYKRSVGRLPASRPARRAGAVCRWRAQSYRASASAPSGKWRRWGGSGAVGDEEAVHAVCRSRWMARARVERRCFGSPSSVVFTQVSWGVPGVPVTHGVPVGSSCDGVPLTHTSRSKPLPFAFRLIDAVLCVPLLAVAARNGPFTFTQIDAVLSVLSDLCV